MASSGSAGLVQTPAAVLVERIKGSDNTARYAAVADAASAGPAALGPLLEIAAGMDAGAAKAARLAVQKIVHYSARPGGGGSSAAAADQLVKWIGPDRPRQVRSDTIYLLGFVADSKGVTALAGLLQDSAVREDARLALERIPGREAERALRSAAGRADGEFRAALQQSLRNRERKPSELGIQPSRTSEPPR